MKKFFTLFASALLCAGVFAQQSSNLAITSASNKVKPRVPISVPHHPFAPQASNQFYIDYDSSDAHQWGAPNSYYIWNMNMHYSAPPDTAWKYGIVAYDSLYDVYTTTGYPLSSVTKIRIDSIYFNIGQMNTSGIDDTLIVKVMNVNAAGYPGATIYWKDTLIIPAATPLSFGNNWLSSVMLGWACGYTVNANRFSIKLEYYGAKTDTAGYIAGFDPWTTNCPNPNTTVANITNFSKIGSFYANSFSYWTQFSVQVPTSTGGNVYYDCDNSGTNVVGIDGQNYQQNIRFIPLVTTNPAGVDELSAGAIRLSQNVPNPFNHSTLISYELTQANDVSLAVYDVTGKKVMELAQGKQLSGKHNITLDGSSLNSGVYYYTLKAGADHLTKKMIIME